MYTIPPTVSDPPTDGPGPRGLVLHFAQADVGPERLAGALRIGLNAARDLPKNTPVEVVIQGPAVKLLAKGSPATDALKTAAAEIQILACSNSLRSAGLATGDLLPEVDVVPAAVGHLTRRQWRGWAYVRV